MFKVIVDECNDAEKLSKYYGLEKLEYAPGEKVNFFVFTATDTNYSVTSNQTFINSDEYNPGGKSYYSFIMPEEEVNIFIKSYGSMANTTYVNPMFQSFLLPGGMSEFQQKINDYANTQLNSLSQEGEKVKMKFCRECGASTEGSTSFCSNCGAIITYYKKQDH